MIPVALGDGVLGAGPLGFGLSDLAAIIGDLVGRIASVPDIGLVWGHDLYDRDDLRNAIVSDIAGRPTLRAWWISGPEMTAVYADAFGDTVDRTWLFTIHAIEGLSPAYEGDPRGPGGDIATLRANCAAVSEAIDADPVFAGGVAQAAQPCSWPVRPEHRMFAGGLAVSYAQIAKQLVSLGP